MNLSVHIIMSLMFTASMLCANIDSAWAGLETLKVSKLVEHHTIFIHQKRPATLTFDSAITYDISPANSKLKVLVAGTKDTVTLIPQENLQPGEHLGPITFGCRTYTLILDVMIAKSPDEARLAYRVEQAQMQEIMSAATEQFAQGKISEEKKRFVERLKSERAEFKAALDAKDSAHATEIARIKEQYGELALLREHSGETEIIELIENDECDGVSEIVVCGLQWTRLDEQAILQFEVLNGTLNEVTLTEFQAFGQGSGTDRAGAVRIGDSEPVQNKDAHLVLRGMQRASVALVVRDAATVGRKVQLLVSGPAVRPAVKYINLRRKKGEGLVTLGLQGIAGAVWLANPIETDKLGATSTAGLALRVRYGFSRRWSFEGELAGAKSGEAQFDGMTFENQEGEIVRSATLGRVIGGGALHFGKKYRPFIRAGLGFQGVSHDSRFTPIGGTQEAGPEVNFEVAGLWVFGLGLDAHLSRSWTAGFGASFVAVASGEGSKRSIEGGLHLSYQWTPRR